MSILPAKTHLATNHCPYQEAWVVFSGQTDVPWLRVLKRGYRHCYLLIHDGHVWMSIDPMLNFTDVQIHHALDADFDFPLYLRQQGHEVIAAPVKRNVHKPAPIAFMSCVEAIKRYLGIHSRFIFTPWQLCKFLKRSKAITKSSNIYQTYRRA